MLLMLEAECGQARRIKREQPSVDGPQSEPPCRQDAKNVSVGDEHAVATVGDDGCAPGEDGLDATGDLLKLLTRGCSGRNGVIPHEP